MNKIYNHIIIGSGFSSFLFNLFLNKKETLIITTKVGFINKLPKRKKLNNYLKTFSKKFDSFGNYNFILKNAKLHDTLTDGGNTNVWGGTCNLKKIKNKLIKLKKIVSFKKISLNDTGSISNNKYIHQIQKLNSEKGEIFNCSNHFNNKISGHLIKINSIKKNLIELEIKKKKMKKLLCRKLILAVNFTQLLEILLNSNIIKDKDLITLHECKFKTKISLSTKLLQNKKDTVLCYSVSGIIKHALGIQKNFHKTFFSFFNLIPFYYYQIFSKKKIKATFKINKYRRKIEEIHHKTDKNFGKSIHYFNMKVNNLNIEKKLSKVNKNIIGVSCPFLTKNEPGPISNNLVERSFYLANKYK